MAVRFLAPSLLFFTFHLSPFTLFPLRLCVRFSALRFEDEDDDEYEDDYGAERAIRGGGRSGRKSGAWLGGRRRR